MAASTPADCPRLVPYYWGSLVARNAHEPSLLPLRAFGRERLMDREKLAEAVDSLEFGVEHHGGIFDEEFRNLYGVDPQAWDLIEDSAPVVVAAARRLLEAEEVWWCKTHKCEGSEPVDGYAICWYAGNHLAQNQRAKVERCHVVPRLLADPEETG